ncbi:MAG: energy transducer TonB, partial [Bacteroidetes bacterium]|nr:energy transducer TonB [Bacteroidota bacterium]
GIGDKPSTGAVSAPAPQIFSYVEQMPEPSTDINSFIGKNLRYPDAARENNIEGRVVLKFVVNEDGSVSDISVLKGIGGGCDEEAKRVLSAMPKWKPGKQNGHAVKVYFTLPIVFKLQ